MVFYVLHDKWQLGRVVGRRPREPLRPHRPDDTIVARNNTTGPPCASDIAGATAVVGDFNLIGNGGSGGLTNGVLGNIVGVTDPDLGSLGPYGGPTQTMALLPGSAGHRQGHADRAASTTDQRGLIRGGWSTSAPFSPACSSSPPRVGQHRPAQLTLRRSREPGQRVRRPRRDQLRPGGLHRRADDHSVRGPTRVEQPVPIFTITGPKAGVTISGGGLSRVFQIDKSCDGFSSRD